MKRIVVTGATSFIGINLIRSLLGQDCAVCAVVRPGTPKVSLLPKNARLQIAESDLSQLQKLPELIGKPCDVFYHLAWNGTRGGPRNDPGLQRQNLNCSLAALKSAAQLGCSVFIDAGSQAEYGVYDRQKITEKFECRPLTEYGKAKLAFFNQATEFCRASGMRLKHPRFFSLYGPGDYEGTMLLSLIRSMLRNQNFGLTECVQMWDFLHIDDAIRGIISLAQTECADGAYNFGSGDARPLREFVEQIHKATGSTALLHYGEVPYPSTGPVSIWPDNAKLRRETGWNPRISFEKGIDDIISFCRKNPA